MSLEFLENLQTALMCRKLAREVHLTEAQVARIDALTEQYLLVILK